MLRIIPSENAKQAKSYYTSSLKHEGNEHKLGNYYAEEQEIIGQWQGKGAEQLSLKGRVDQRSFEALCDNLVPGTKDCLTVRMKENRRVGYDFNFNCPKSVSVVHALTGDDRILGAFRESVSETMRQIESEMKTRVRLAKAQEDRKSGNLIWGEFIHFTARPVEGRPDPHLHAHCFAFNATYDAVEKRWKAGQFGAIKRDGEYYEAAFHARLAQRMTQLGYGVDRSGEWWEIQGVSRDVLEKFSQRTEKIEQVAKEQGVCDAQVKEKLAALTREKKVKVSMDDLKREWASRLTQEEKDGLLRLRGHQQGEITTARESMDYALAHCHERASVVTDKALVTEALWHGIGQVGVGEVERQLYREDILMEEKDGRRWCTTKEVIQKEVENIRYVRKGYGRCRPLHAEAYAFQNLQLGPDQKEAVTHVTTSPDRVMAIRGPAGAGKTTMMQEAVRAIESGGHKVFTFAPSAESSRGTLRQEGFFNAETVAHLLQNQSLHPQLRGQVLWIDEAGLLSVRQMHEIFQLAERQDCGFVLSGDPRQHTAVERGDALRLLEKYAELKPAELTEIRRQKDEQYREAVREFSKNNLQGGFEKLDQMGAIKEAGEKERYGQLAADYADVVARRKTALVVSPTHAEGEKVTLEIRKELMRRGKLGRDEREFARLINRQWTEAQLSHAANYRPGLVVQLHQNAPGFTRGQKVTVLAVSSDGTVHVKNQDGHELKLPLDQSGRFQVYEAETLSLADGDKLKITQNGFTLDGNHRLNNGATYELKGFTKDGDLKLKNGWVIDKNYGNIAYGYCQTSHVAQSKTVDHVFVAQSMRSLAASSAEQFYVSVSRAREAVTVYTDDKERLAEAIQASGARVSAHELLKVPAARKVVDPFESVLREKAVLSIVEKVDLPAKSEREKAIERRRTLSRSPRQRMNHADNARASHQSKQGMRL